MHPNPAAFGEFDNLKLLLLYGADLTLRAEEGYTAAHAALWYAATQRTSNSLRTFT